MSRGRTSHEFSGAKPKERAITILETYEGDVIDNIKIEIKEEYEDTASDDQTENDAKSGGNTKSEDKVESVDGQKDEGERQLGEISSGTNHQKVLYAIQKLDPEAPVEATRIEEWIERNTGYKLKRGSIFGALHDLYKRRLIDRDKNDQHNHEYKITVDGDDQLQKVGEP